MKKIVQSGEFTSTFRLKEEGERDHLQGGVFHWHLFLHLIDPGLKTIEQARPLSEIKSQFGGFINKYMNNACLVNCCDMELMNFVTDAKIKRWEMSLWGDHMSCDPNITNIAMELLIIASEIFRKKINFVFVDRIRLSSAPDFLVEIQKAAIQKIPISNALEKKIKEWNGEWNLKQENKEEKMKNEN